MYDKSMVCEVYRSLEKLSMSNPVSFQTVIEYVDALSPEDLDLLFELIRKKRIEQRRQEIASNAAETLAAFAAGQAKRGTIADLRADLFVDNENSCLGW